MGSELGHESGEVSGRSIGSAASLNKTMAVIGALLWGTFFSLLALKVFGVVSLPWWIIIIPLVFPFVAGLLVVVILHIIIYWEDGI